MIEGLDASNAAPAYSGPASKLAEYAAFRVFTGMMAPDFTLADLIRDMQASEPYQQIVAVESAAWAFIDAVDEAGEADAYMHDEVRRTMAALRRLLAPPPPAEVGP